MKKFLILFMLLCALPAFALSSAVRDSYVEGVNGFRMEKLRFELEYMTFDIVNMNKNTLTFAATMSFLDLRNRTVAEAELLPRRIAGETRSSYKIYFTMGSCGEAQRSN